MKFAQILNQTMREKNISNYEMSKKTGISDSLIGYWRKGERIPKADNLLTIANFLECSADYLLGRTDEPQIPNSNNISQNNIGGNATANIGAANNEKINADTYELLKMIENLSIVQKAEIILKINEMVNEK